MAATPRSGTLRNVMFWSRVKVRWPSPWRSARSANRSNSDEQVSPSGRSIGDAGQARRALRAHAGAPAAGRARGQDGHPVGLLQHARRRASGGWGRARASANAVVHAARKPSGPRRSSTNFMRPLAGSSRSPWATNTSTRASTAATRSSRGTNGCEQHGERRRLAQAAAGPQLVAGAPVDHHRDQPGVVEQGVVAAAGRAAEGHVEPGRQLHVQLGRAGDQGVGHQAGVGEAVEGLVEADAGVLGAHDVAHRVPAGRAGREPVAGQGVEHVRHLAVGHPVQLDVLAGGEVQPVLGVPGGHAGQAPGLARWAATRRGSGPGS